MRSGIDLKKHGFTIGIFVVAFVALIYFYLKVKKKHPHSAGLASSPALATDFKRKHFKKGILLFSESTDLENVKDKSVSPEKSASGMRSSHLSMNNEFGYAIEKKIAEIPDYKTLTTVQIRFKCWMRNDVAGAQYMLDILDKDGKKLSTLSKPVVCPKTYDWNELQLAYSIDPQFLEPSNTLRIYAWNKELREFYIDDISVSFFAEDKNAASANPQFASNFFYDFETVDPVFKKQSDNIKEGKAHSGKMVFDLSNAADYGPVVTRQVGDVSLQPAKRINTSIWVYPIAENASIDIAVALFNEKNEKYFLQTKRIDTRRLPKDRWTKVNASIMLPPDGAPLDDVIQLSVRNRSKTKMLFDDLEIVYDDMGEAPGGVSALSAETLYNNAFRPERNKAPFRTIIAEKAEIGNNNSTYLVDNGKSKAGDLTPGDEFLSGDFMGNGTDQLIAIKQNEVALYSFCSDKKQFVESWKNAIRTPDDLFGATTIKLVGDFDHKGTDDVLLIDTKKKTAVLGSFSGKDNCGATPGMPLWTLDPSKAQPFENWNISSDDVFIKGDLNADQKTDLLIVNAKSGNWGLFQRVDKSGWKAIATGGGLETGYFNSTTGHFIAGNFSQAKKGDVLYASQTLKGTTSYMRYEYNTSRRQIEGTRVDAESAEAFFRHGNATLAGNFDDDAEEELLDLDTSWRFDLKLIDIDAKGMAIAGRLDFKGYPADHNPKYYECVKIVAGRFTDKDKTSLLVIMRNCADANYSGKACQHYENLDYLPNSTQLYQLQY